MTYTGINGQSTYDICLQKYGTFDLYIKMLSDNGLNSTSNPSQVNISIDDTNSRINTNNIGLKYATSNTNSSDGGGRIYDDAYGGAYG